MKSTIVLCTTNQNSFSEIIIDKIASELDKKMKPYELIDLYKDNFNPVMTAEGEKLYSQGKASDVLVEKYQRILKDTDEIFFVFPIWWNNVPAMLKGFFDKVFIKDFAFKESDGSPVGLLNNIKCGLVATTSEMDMSNLKSKMENPIENTIIKATLYEVGMSNIKWINNNVATTNKEEFMIEIENYFK